MSKVSGSTPGEHCGGSDCGDELTGSVTESSQSLLRNDGGFTQSHFLVSQCGHYTLYLVHVDGGPGHL
jgi:hypothetical protein